MPIHRIGRVAWLLPVLATFLVLPAMGRDQSKPAKPEQQHEPSEFTRIIYRVIANEWQVRQKLQEFSPRVETYIQFYQPDSELGDIATKDGYFLGRIRFELGKAQISTEAKEDSFILEPNAGRVGGIRARIHLDEFAAQSLVVDENNFDRDHYTFDPVRWEYLGNLRCLAIDLHPKGNVGPEAFEGRIWVEDHDYNIVRLNGKRNRPAHWGYWAHFDCWRENMQPGLWMPVYIYSQESDIGRRLRYKAQTRLWGYDLTAHREQQEWTNIMVEATAPVHDNSEHLSDLTPVEGERQLTMDAERNVLDRLERARLIAPPGPVDKVLETVVNNLRVTNHLDNLPPVQCRVMLTSSMESFSLAYTIVLSRGLIDVLPDEASLAMVLSHELAHIALGHKLDTKYAFNDRVQVSDEQLLATLDFSRSHADEMAADDKGIQFLDNSPYKDSLGHAGLFLRAALDAAPHVPHLFGPHLGDGLMEGSDKMIRMYPLITSSPELVPTNVTQIAALPLGSRVQVNSWDGTVAFTTRKAVPINDASEKMPFRISPTIPYLKMYEQPPKTQAEVKN